MKRWLGLLAGLMAVVLLAACTRNGDNGSSAGGQRPPLEQTASPTPAPTEPPPVGSQGPSAALEVLQGFFQPLGLTGAPLPLGGLTAGGSPDLSGSLTQGGLLEGLLLTAEDVPTSYQKLFSGSFNFDTSFEDPSLGTVNMAMSMFADEGQQQGIVSMVMQAENEAALQQGLAEASEADFAEVQQELEGYSLFGIQIANVRPVDASGLGDGGFGLGFTMDFSALSAERGGAYPQEGAEFSTMDMEMVMFVDGSLAGMVITFAMDGTALASRSYAEIMAAKVAAAAL